MAKYSEEIKKIEQIITTTKELEKAFSGDIDSSYKNGIRLVQNMRSECNELLTELRAWKEQARYSTRGMEGGNSGFNLEQERAKMKAEGKVL